MSGASQAQINAAHQVMRQAIDATGFGNWVSDDKLMPEAVAVANVVHALEPRPPVVTPQTPPPTPATDQQSG